MKLYRYMSINEFLKLMSGEKLTNTNKFSMNRTDSEGFCFWVKKQHTNMVMIMRKVKF